MAQRFSWRHRVRDAAKLDAEIGVHTNVVKGVENVARRRGSELKEAPEELKVLLGKCLLVHSLHLPRKPPLDVGARVRF